MIRSFSSEKGFDAINLSTGCCVARKSDMELTDGLVDGGEMQIFSLDLNWWLSPIFNLNFDYRWITLDRFGVEGDGSGFMSWIVLMLG